MTTKSLGQAIATWGQTRSVLNTRLVNLTRIAFKVYVLPSLGYEFVSQLSPSKFSNLCYEINITDIEPGRTFEAFDQAFELRAKASDISARTKGNYRSAIGKFFTWLETQDWYIEQFNSTKLKVQTKRVYANRLPSKVYGGNRLYGLKEEDLTPEILLDLKRYEDFWSQDNYTVDFIDIYSNQVAKTPSERRIQRLKQAEEEAREGIYSLTPVFSKSNRSTISQRKDYMLRFLGWCVNIEGYDINDLYLALLTRKAFYIPYIDWLRQSRNCGASVGLKVLETSLSLAKYLNFKNSKTVDWSDIPLVEFLRTQRDYFRELDKMGQSVIQAEKWSKKEISHHQARKVIDYLYENNCGSYLVSSSRIKRKRHLSALFESWQTYLMIKILVYTPVRQEELRKLRIDKTIRLVEDSQGVFRYVVKIKEHKNARKTGKPRYYPLPKILTKDITAWINEIRPLAINAPKNVDSWLVFWGHSLQKMSRLEDRLHKAEAEETPNEKYCENAKILLRAMKNRLDAWETAKRNAENCDHLFFALGRSFPKTFCSSFEDVHYGGVTNRIEQAMANATLSLFGEAKFLNPHAFRHIGAKHLRALGKDEDKEAFSMLVGHTVEIDDDYAEMITDEYNLIECVVDDWWE